MGLAAIRAGLVTNASTLYGLHAFAYMPDVLTPPAFVVGEITWDYNGTMGRGTEKVEFTAYVLVARTYDRAAEDLLDDYVTGSTGIKEALETDKTLAGAAKTLRVVSLATPRVIPAGGTDYYGAELTGWVQT